MGFPYTFPFLFEVPLVYQRDYHLEVRDASGVLLRLVAKIKETNLSDVLNSPSELKVSIPFSDLSIPFLNGPNELWLIDQLGATVGKFIVAEREDKNEGGDIWVEIIALSYLYQLSEEKISYFELEGTAENIVVALLNRQTNANPLVHGSLPASVTGLTRNLKISSQVSILQVLLSLIGTFFPNIRITVDSDRNVVWTDLDDTPGELKQFRITKNLRGLIKSYKFERAITRLFAFGSRKSGNYIRLGDEDGDQRWSYRVTNVTTNVVTLYNVFEDNDDPSSIVKIGDVALIEGIEYTITNISSGGNFTIITLSEDVSSVLTSPGSLTVKRDFVESNAYGTLVRKKIRIDYRDVDDRAGYGNYVLTIDDTYKDLISVYEDLEIYFLDEDLSTVLSSTTNTYTKETGVLDAEVVIPRVSPVKKTIVYLVLARGLTSHGAAGAPNVVQVPFTIYPAVNISGFKEGSFVDERIETVDMLHNTALVKLKEYQKPSFSHSAKAIDLSKIRQAQYEIFEVGEVIHIIDEELDIDDMAKIVRADWPIGRPSELKLEFGVEESRTIDSMFSDMGQSYFEPEPPLILGSDTLLDLGGDDVAHTHDNKPTLDSIPTFSGTQSPTFPSVNSGGAFWSNIPALYDDNDGVDTANCSTPNKFLLLTGFSNTVEVDRVITGVEVRFAAISTDDMDFELRLLIDDGGEPTITGQAKIKSIGTSFQEYVVGGSTDLWGADLNVDIVNDANFGVRIHIDDTETIGVDWIKIIVYHEQRDGGNLRKVGTNLEWAKAQEIHLARVIAGPGIEVEQEYSVELLSPVNKSDTGVIVNECFVADDSAPDYLPGDLVTVSVPSEGSDDTNDHAIILSATGGATVIHFPTQHFGIFEGSVKSVFDGS